MKKIVFFSIALCILSVIRSHAQVAINTDSSAADPSAILDLKSPNKGLLLPRMKDLSTNPIANPTTGLIVFDSATNKNWIYNLYGWEPQTPFNLPFSGEYQSITTPLVITNHGGHAISALSYGPYTSAGFFYGDSGALSMQMHGPLQIFGNGEGAGKVLTSDADGVATWQTPVGGLTLPYSASGSSASAALSISNTSTTGNAVGVYGSSASSSGGSVQSGATGLQGELTATSGGGYSAGVRGINRSTTGNGIGVVGYQAGSGYGVYGEAPTGRGVVANSASGIGLYALSTSGTGAYITSSSGNALFTSGKIQLTGISEGAGKVLTSDASGNATWQTPATTSRVGFSARPASSSSVNGNGTTYTLTNFRTPSFNDGSAFNASTGVFTAPSDGMYHFDVVISFTPQGQDIANAAYRGFLYVNNLVAATTGSTVALINGYFSSVTVSANIKLSTGDQVNTKFYNSANAPVTIPSFGDGFDGYFSGYKVY